MLTVFPTLTRGWLALPVGCLTLATAGAQQPGAVASRTLAAPTRSIGEPFSSVVGAHERRDGSLVVLDARENAIVLVDREGNRHAIGRPGGGPGEHLLAISLVGLAGDTTLVADAGKRVFHIVLPDRTMRTTLPWPADVGLGLANVRGVDARGRIYFVSDPWAAARQAGAGENYVVRGDSVPLLRWDRVTGRVEPIAMLRITSPDDSEERRVAIRSGGVPFAPRDDAIAAQHGHVTIVRATPYQVDVVTPDGRWLPGTPLAHTPVRLTEADRQEFRQTRRGSRFVSTGTAGGAPDLSADPIWDEYKPPFPFGRGVLTALDGTTWVLRWGAHGDSMQTYDLIDASGTLVSRLQLAAGSRVVTFAGNGVWVAREDNDGLLWLSRHNVTTG